MPKPEVPSVDELVGNNEVLKQKVDAARTKSEASKEKKVGEYFETQDKLRVARLSREHINEAREHYTALATIEPLSEEDQADSDAIEATDQVLAETISELEARAEALRGLPDVGERIMLREDQLAAEEIAKRERGEKLKAIDTTAEALYREADKTAALLAEKMPGLFDRIQRLDANIRHDIDRGLYDRSKLIEPLKELQFRLDGAKQRKRETIDELGTAANSFLRRDKESSVADFQAAVREIHDKLSILKDRSLRGALDEIAASPELEIFEAARKQLVNDSAEINRLAEEIDALSASWHAHKQEANKLQAEQDALLPKGEISQRSISGSLYRRFPNIDLSSKRYRSIPDEDFLNQVRNSSGQKPVRIRELAGWHVATV